VTTGEPKAWSVPWGELTAVGAVLERAEGELEYWKATGEIALDVLHRYPQVQ